MTAADIEKILESYEETERDLHRQAVAVMAQAQQEIEQLSSMLDVGAVSYDRDVVQGGTQSMLAESVIDTVDTIRKIAKNKVEGIYEELYKLQCLYCCVLKLSPKEREVITRLYLPHNKTEIVAMQMFVNRSTVSKIKRKALTKIAILYEGEFRQHFITIGTIDRHQAIQSNTMRQ